MRLPAQIHRVCFINGQNWHPSLRRRTRTSANCLPGAGHGGNFTDFRRRRAMPCQAVLSGVSPPRDGDYMGHWLLNGGRCTAASAVVILHCESKSWTTLNSDFPRKILREKIRTKTHTSRARENVRQPEVLVNIRLISFSVHLDRRRS
jgi:hypothetical protein